MACRHLCPRIPLLAAANCPRDVTFIRLDFFSVHFYMLRLQLVLAWRNVVRRRFYALIEVLGLALGLVCFFIVFLYVDQQFNADRSFRDHDKIYRILNHERGSGNRYSGGASAIGHHIREEVTEVEDVVRIWYPYRNFSTRGIIRYNDVSFYDDNVIEADSNFFQFFDSLLSKEMRQRRFGIKTALCSASVQRRGCFRMVTR